MKKVKQSKKRWALTEAQKRKDSFVKKRRYSCNCSWCLHLSYDYRQSIEHKRTKKLLE